MDVRQQLSAGARGATIIDAGARRGGGGAGARARTGVVNLSKGSRHMRCVPPLATAPLLLLLSLVAASPAATSAANKQPNIVWFLTDDQDQLLGASFPRAAPGGATPMPKTKKLMEDQGAMAMNFHIHTPICNPSRSELLSGRYFHNIKTVGGPLWSMHVNEERVNAATFAVNLKQVRHADGPLAPLLAPLTVHVCPYACV